MSLDLRRPYGWYEEYHPYGTTAWQAPELTTISLKRYKYTGMERDEETGLQRHGVRYYATWLGRWTSADPIGLGDGVNRFGYCHGGPVGSIDRSGCGDAETAAVVHDAAVRTLLDNDWDATAAQAAVTGVEGITVGLPKTRSALLANLPKLAIGSLKADAAETPYEHMDLGPFGITATLDDTRLLSPARALRQSGLDVLPVVPGTNATMPDLMIGSIVAHVSSHVANGEVGADALSADLKEAFTYGLEYAIAERAGVSDRVAEIDAIRGEWAAAGNWPGKGWVRNFETAYFAASTFVDIDSSGKTLSGFSGDDLLATMLTQSRGGSYGASSDAWDQLLATDSSPETEAIKATWKLGALKSVEQLKERREDRQDARAASQPVIITIARPGAPR